MTTPQTPSGTVATLFEHNDGRYAVALGTESPAFTHNEPAWHRVGPVDISALALGSPSSAVGERGELHPQAGYVFEYLRAELEAISCRYRGDPSYDHDAYWMRDKVRDLLSKAETIFAAPAVQAAEQQAGVPGDYQLDDIDVADLIAGRLGVSRAYAYEAMAKGLNDSGHWSAHRAQQAGAGLTDEQRVYLDQAQQELEDRAIEQDERGNNSIARGCEASAHVIRQMLAADALRAKVEPSDEQVYALAKRIADEHADWSVAKFGVQFTGPELLTFVKALQGAKLADAQAPAWRPIESAPKDGTPILLRSKKGRVADGCWITATSSCGGWAWPYVNQEPVEWIRLAAPSAAGREEASQWSKPDRAPGEDGFTYG